MGKIPQTMLAIAVDRFGGPEVLTLETIPVPEVEANEVLIAVHTAGVGVWDAEMRDGWSPGEAHFPLILGTDGSGFIAAVGSRVRRFEGGESVYAYSFANPKGGFYAEYVAVAASKVAPIPHRHDLLRAGAIPTTGLTALQGIDDALHLRKGECIVIHGASGGVGSLAVQFAKLRGATVVGTARGDDGLAFVRGLGADEAVDSDREDVSDAVQRVASNGIGAILAFAGGNPLNRCIEAMNRGGRVAYPNGVEPAPEPRKGIDIKPYDAVAGVREFKRLEQAIEEGKTEVPIAGAFPLAGAAKAHDRLARRHVFGKVVLRIR